MKPTSIKTDKNERSDKTSTLFEIYAIGEGGMLPDYKKGDCYVITWLLSGKGSYEMSHLSAAMKPDELLFIAPGQRSILNLAAGSKGYQISFSPAFINTRDPQIRHIDKLLGLMQLDRLVSVELRPLISAMNREYFSNASYREDLLSNYLTIFLTYLFRNTEDKPVTLAPTRQQQILEKFMALLDANFRDKKMVGDYADALSVNPNYLNEVIKRLSGNSVGYHIRQRITLEAKIQALCIGRNMKGIAYDLGFIDTSHFSKFFKNNTGMNFSDFKNSSVLP
jgi:AraC family transcriptional activator of pobA